MSFSTNHFGPGAGQSRRGNVPATWLYKTQDSHAVVKAAGYFNPMATKLAVGDMVDVVVVSQLGTTNETVQTYGRHIVLANANGQVELSSVTAGLVTV